MTKNEFILKYLKNKGFTIKNGLVLKSQKDEARKAIWLNDEFDSSWSEYFSPFWKKLVRSSFPNVDGEKPIYLDDLEHKTVWRTRVSYKSKPEMGCILECSEGLWPLGKLTIFSNLVSEGKGSYFEPVLEIFPALSTDDPLAMNLVQNLTEEMVKDAYNRLKALSKKPPSKMTRQKQIDTVRVIVEKWPAKVLRNYLTEAYDDEKEVAKMTNKQLVDSYLKNAEDQGMLQELAERAKIDGHLDGDLQHLVDMFRK